MPKTTPEAASCTANTPDALRRYGEPTQDDRDILKIIGLDRVGIVLLILAGFILLYSTFENEENVWRLIFPGAYVTPQRQPAKTGLIATVFFLASVVWTTLVSLLQLRQRLEQADEGLLGGPLWADYAIVLSSLILVLAIVVRLSAAQQKQIDEAQVAIL